MGHKAMHHNKINTALQTCPHFLLDNHQQPNNDSNGPISHTATLIDDTSIIITYSNLPYFIHHFQGFGKPLGISLNLCKKKFSLQEQLIMANHLSLIYLLMIAPTYNQPLTTSNNHQHPKHLQKVQPELVSLVFLLDPLLFPMSTSPNCSLTPSIMIFPNHKSMISKHKQITSTTLLIICNPIHYMSPCS
jgi:hypothetical protein